MSLILYERLVGGDRRPSPFCWRARFALAHKGLSPEIVAIRFTEAKRVAFSGQGKVPVLVDGEEVIWDSWSIACYLEKAYPDRPSLFGGAGGQALARFVNHWVECTLQQALAVPFVPSLYDLLEPVDKAYFRETREARFGRSLESLRGERAGFMTGLAEVLAPLRLRLSEAPFLCGEVPAYGDYLVFAVFQWARCTDPEDLLPDPDCPIRAWRARMLDLFEGLARSVPAFESAA
ncbi:MAG: glutathione S-transferase N-terminal domain-containing protein [Pseudomonadota bacterium]